jgi:hypothetical protein
MLHGAGAMGHASSEREGQMLAQYHMDHRPLEVIARSPGSALDDIVFECLDLTWNQVFITIDRLSREGTLSLARKGRGLYTVRLSNQALHQAGQPVHD